MTSTVEREADRQLKARHRAMWASGNYPAVATELIAALGPELVRACGVRAGRRVLDVGAGSGNAAIPAAVLGAGSPRRSHARAVRDRAADRRRARSRAGVGGGRRGGAALRGRFVRCGDVVRRSDVRAASPGHRGRADPGLSTGWHHRDDQLDAGGLHRQPLQDHGAVRPAAPRWGYPAAAVGHEEHVRELFGDRVTALDLRRQQIVMDRCPDPTEFREYWKRNYGPTIAVYKFNAADPDRVAHLDRVFLEFLTTWNRGGRYEAEYLLVIARKREP